MAKRIECPNCGAPAKLDVAKVNQLCEYCGESFTLVGTHASKSTGVDVDHAMAALAQRQLDVELKQAYRAAMERYQAHMQTRAHEKSTLQPGWSALFVGENEGLRAIAVAMAGFVLSVAFGILGLLVDGKHGLPDWAEALVGAGFCLMLLGPFVFTGISLMLGGPVAYCFPSTPVRGWRAKQIALAREVERLALMVGSEFSWPQGLPQSEAAADSADSQAIAQATARASEFGKRVAISAAIALGLLSLAAAYIWSGVQDKLRK